MRSRTQQKPIKLFIVRKSGKGHSSDGVALRRLDIPITCLWQLHAE